MSVLAVLGVLTALLMPRFQSFMASAKRAESRETLSMIHALQQIYLNEHWKYADMERVGYLGNSNHCPAYRTPLAHNFREDCADFRYSYYSKGDGHLNHVTIAYAPSDKDGKYIYGDCDGSGATVYGYSQGDVLRVQKNGKVVVCRDIKRYCGGGTGNTITECTGTPPPAPTSVALATPNTLGTITPITPPSSTTPVTNPNCKTQCSQVCGNWSDVTSSRVPNPATRCSNKSFTVSLEMTRTCANNGDWCFGLKCQTSKVEVRHNVAGTKNCGAPSSPNNLVYNSLDETDTGDCTCRKTWRCNFSGWVCDPPVIRGDKCTDYGQPYPMYSVECETARSPTRISGTCTTPPSSLHCCRIPWVSSGGDSTGGLKTINGQLVCNTPAQANATKDFVTQKINEGILGFTSPHNVRVHKQMLWEARNP